MVDPYLDEHGVLKNKLGIRDVEKLTAVEATAASVRALQLLRKPLPSSFDADLLKLIHENLFSDVYRWAGKFRITGLAKRAYEGESTGITSFTQPLQIEAQLRTLFRQLPDASDLSGMTADNFAKATAPFFVQLNNIQPFREGNGRAQRLFFTLLAKTCGHDLSWDVITKERMVVASIKGSQGDDTAMVRLFTEISNPRRVAAMRKALGFLKNSSAVQWNDLYIATTTAGQTYDGVLVGTAGSDFMVRVQGEDEQWIAIGDASDLPDDKASGDDITISPRLW